MVVFIRVGTATILILQALEIVVYEPWFQGIGRGCDRRLLKRHLLCTHWLPCSMRWESNINNWPPYVSQTCERYFMKPLHRQLEWFVWCSPWERPLELVLIPTFQRLNRIRSPFPSIRPWWEWKVPLMKNQMRTVFSKMESESEMFVC